MNSFESILAQLEDKDVLSQLGKSVDAKPDQVKKAAQLGLPTLMEALNRNSNDTQGAASLSKALDGHRGFDLDDIGGFLKDVDTDDGAKILGHVLGDKNDKVQNKIAKKTGLDAGQIGSLLIKFAPLILSFLGNKKEEENLDDDGISGLTSTLAGLFGGGGSSSSGGSLLGGLLGGGSSSGGGNLLGMATSLLDDDDDDEGGVGDLLGSLFK